MQGTGLTLEPTASPTLLPPPAPLTHTVKAGEFLWRIAQTYSTTVEAITTANRITDPRMLQIGQVLVIPTGEASPLPVASSSPVIEYTIKAGDTLLALALAHETTVATILALNPGLEPTLLQIGQRVRLPARKASERQGVSEQEVIGHEIARGDTLLALAFTYGTSVEAILAANPGLNPRLLQIGQQIVIPRESPPLATTAQSRPVMATPVFSAGLTVLEQAMLKAVNDERTARGLAAYASDETLTRVARAHAQDMAARKYFSHVTPEGKTLRDRLREAGVEKDWVGENIQRNTRPADKTVQRAMAWFMDSSPHRNNILAQEYTRLGVGLVEGPPGWYTFVLVFAGET